MYHPKASHQACKDREAPITAERPLGSSYVLQDVIGRGAMGQVWRGRDRDGHLLAFKLLRPELTQDPKVVQRFVQERSLLTSIRHPRSEERRVGKECRSRW